MAAYRGNIMEADMSIDLMNWVVAQINNYKHMEKEAKDMYIKEFCNSQRAHFKAIQAILNGKKRKIPTCIGCDVLERVTFDGETTIHLSPPCNTEKCPGPFPK